VSPGACNFGSDNRRQRAPKITLGGHTELTLKESKTNVNRISTLIPKPLPTLHDPLLNQRALIETIDGWQVWGPDRRCSGYAESFHNQATGVQLLSTDSERPRVSILTPASTTGGRFQIACEAASTVVSKCCYSCVAREVFRMQGVRVPSHKQWVIYMLLESTAYMNGKAPREKA
jgi:hypothetical protein